MDDLPPLANVTGLVTLDGQPVPGAFVTFVPQQAGRPSSAVADEKGKYILTYDNEHQGAAVGKHLVSVKTAVAAEYDENRKLIPGTGIEESIPAKYHSPSTLVLEVVPGKNELDIVLQK